MGVTYEREVDCGSAALHYSWTFLESAGRVFPLPAIDTHRQTLTLPSYLLDYDTYTAVARVRRCCFLPKMSGSPRQMFPDCLSSMLQVQVVDSVVYSNYSLRVQVVPSPPVASILGGTNVFVSRNAVVSLDGQKSHDPDFPRKPLR